MEHILSLYPFAEISILRDFNVYHQLWLSSSFTDHPGELTFNFAIFHDLEQLADTSNSLDLFLASNSTNVPTLSSSPIVLFLLW